MVFKALGIFGGSQVLSILCGVVRTKLVAIWLGTTGVGLFAIFNSALNLISGLSQLNLRTSAIRAIASDEGSPRQSFTIRGVRHLSMWLGVAGLLLMLLTAPIFSLRTFGNLSYTSSFMLLGIAVMLMALTMADQVTMQGLRLYRPLAVSNIRAVVAALIVTVPLILLLGERSVIWVIISYAVTGWVCARISARTIPVQGPAPDLSRLWQMGRPILLMGFYLTLASVTAELCSYIFIAWLNHAGGTEEVGLFQSGYTLVHRYIGMVFSAIGVEFFPRLTTVATSSRRTSVYVSHEILLLTIVLLGVISLFIPLAPLGVRILYSSEFLPIVPFVILSMPGVVAQGVSWCMAYVMLSRGHGRLYMVTEVVSTILMISLNIFFYRLYGLPGVGFSFSFYYILYASLVGWIYLRRFRLSVSRTSVWLSLIVLALVTVMTVLALSLGPLSSLSLAIPCAIISFILARRMYRR